MSTSRSHLALLALLATCSVGGVLAIGAGCTVLTNDALPDDAGVFEAGDASRTPSACARCLAASCAAPQALCLTSASCVGVLACAGAPACDATCKTACACNATPGPDASPGASGERLHHAFTACNDALLSACATDCAAESRAPSTLPGCSTSDVDAGLTDAGTPDGSTDAGAFDAGAPDAAPAPNACAACASSACAPASAACGIGTECAAFLACSSGCTTRSCVDDCAGVHTTGKVTAGELAACTAASCQNDCEL